MKRKLSTLGFIGIVAFFSFAQEQESITEQNILRVREALGNKILTNAEAVIERHVEAIGGREAVMAIRTMIVKGRNARLGSDDMPLIRYQKQPGLSKQMRTPGSKNYTLSDGENTWTVTPEGRTEITAWWGKSIRHDRIDGNFINYQERSIRYDFIGLKSFDTEPFVYYHLRRTFADGYSEDLCFDIDSGLLHAVWSTSSPIKDSPRILFQYKRVGGMLFPHAWMRVHDKAAPPHLFLVEEIRVNEQLDTDFFK